MDCNLNFLHEEIKHIKERNLYREFKTIKSNFSEWVTIGDRRLLNLSSNNYLGVAGDPRVLKAAVSALETNGFGATASRLVVGNNELYDRLENEIADFHGAEAALVYNSGYTANIGVIPALVGRGDLVISDKLNHASIIDGIILSRAEHRRYRHGDLNSLEKILWSSVNYRRLLIITETVFSMDGDLAQLKEIVELKKKYGALLMVDEAHAGGVFGTNGQGLAEAVDVTQSIEIKMGTFSKAFGGAGAYIVGNKLLIEYLRNKSRSLIYTTGLPPVIVGGLLEALRIVREESWRRKKLYDKAIWFREALQQEGFNTLNSQSQIVPVVIGSTEKILTFSNMLFEDNLLVTAIRPPTVPQNTARLRIALMATHTDEDLQMSLEKIVRVGRKIEVI